MIKESREVNPGAKIEGTSKEEKIQSVLESMGGVRNIAETMEQFSDFARRLESLLLGVTREHPNKWVAVNRNGEVVGIRKSHEALLQYLRRSGINTSSVVIRFLEHYPHRTHILSYLER